MRHGGLWVLLAASIILSGCGRRGDIRPPDGAPEDPRIENFRKEMEREAPRRSPRSPGSPGSPGSFGPKTQKPLSPDAPIPDAPFPDDAEPNQADSRQLNPEKAH